MKEEMDSLQTSGDWKLRLLQRQIASPSMEDIAAAAAADVVESVVRLKAEEAGDGRSLLAARGTSEAPGNHRRRGSSSLSIYLYFYRCIWLSQFLYVSLSVSLCISHYFSQFLYVYLSVTLNLSVYLSPSLSVSLSFSVWLSVLLSVAGEPIYFWLQPPLK